MGAVRVWLPLRSHLYNGACMRGWPSEETDGCVNIKAVVCGRGTTIALSPGGLRSVFLFFFVFSSGQPHTK